MRKLLLTAALILLAPIMAIAQGLSIDGPTEPIKPKSPVWLTIVGVEDGASAVFFPSDQMQSGPPHIMPLSALFWAETAGTYRVNAIVVDWSAQTLVPLTYTVIVEGENGPDPPPPPPPPEGPYQIAIFHESDFRDNMTMDQVELVNGLVFREALEGKGHSWLGSFDIDETGPGTGKKIPERVKAWFEKASGHTMPVLCFSPLEGGEITVHPLPANAAGVWTLLGDGS